MENKPRLTPFFRVDEGEGRGGVPHPEKPPGYRPVAVDIKRESPSALALRLLYVGFFHVLNFSYDFKVHVAINLTENAQKGTWSTQDG